MYHHGNLKETLIEKGIEYVNENGYSTLSLRKLAAMSDVSHAAVYKHFASKEDLFLAMKEHVKAAFASQLERAVEKHMNEGKEEVLYALAVAYVELFTQHPDYYYFIYTSADININFDEVQMPSNYRPFEIFRDTASSFLGECGVAEKDKVEIIIGMWAVVHGITEIATMKGITYSGDWSKLIRSILENNFYIQFN